MQHKYNNIFLESQKYSSEYWKESADPFKKFQELNKPSPHTRQSTLSYSSNLGITNGFSSEKRAEIMTPYHDGNKF